MNKIDTAILKNRIATTDLPGVPKGTTFRPACVFLLLFDTNQPHLVFIQKADTEGYPWRNQMALPGGHIDPGDASPVETAFRELEEELQIKLGFLSLVKNSVVRALVHQLCLNY